MDIGYEFKDKSLLDTAMTHVSLANETGVLSNQRLEFLGDSILSFIVATHIYAHYPDLPEGKLTEFRAMVVCEKSLMQVAKSLDLGSALKMSRSEMMSRGWEKPSILADTFEAVLGAIYLDADIDTVSEWALGLLKDIIEESSTAETQNYKTELQIFFQKKHKDRSFVEYRLKSRTGPDHVPTFTVEAVYNGVVVGTGVGNNKKVADQEAAKDALGRVKSKE